MTLTEIRTEISRLTLEEQFELFRSMNTTYDAWDLQMNEDSKPGGKLDRMCQKALAAHKRGETEEWP